MTRWLVAVLAILGGFPSVSIAGSTTTVGVETTIADLAALPQATVTSTWERNGSAVTLRTAGYNLPACQSIVAATWTGSSRVARDGSLLTVTHDYEYASVRPGGGSMIQIEYKAGSRWLRLSELNERYTGSIESIRSVSERFVVRTPTLSGRTVTVRLTISVVYPEAAKDISDSIGIRPAA